jgi:hypothetical protein
MTLSGRSLELKIGQRFLRKTLLALATIVIATCPAMAGGPGWLVEIVAIERIDASHAVLKLRNASGQIHVPFQACDTLVVTADYKRESWPRTWSDRVTEEVHESALDAVAQMHESGETFMFGYIGTGLVHESVRTTCRVIARGLQFHPDLGLIAYHDRI